MTCPSTGLRSMTKSGGSEIHESRMYGMAFVFNVYFLSQIKSGFGDQVCYRNLAVPVPLTLKIAGSG